ncbi:MAG: EutN/CcmL family microcompartment protein [Verrucomicrobia bacterium]|nr:EutN/CcmL family microcompartment protein [Verrucomicrobiota bacterium]
MILARVDGVIVTTICHPSMVGCRTIICQPLDDQGREEGAPILALDPQGAGQHERVLVSTDGSHTREFVKDPRSPLRNMILAIVDAKAG